MSLIGRDDERRALHDAWQDVLRGSSRMAVIWGRRRVGKTFLIAEALRDLPQVFFTATRNDAEPEQLVRLHEAAVRGLGERADLAGGGFRTLEDALRFFLRLSVDHPFALVLDEVPRLARARQDLGDVINAAWESAPGGARLLLVLCGSAVSAMRDLIGPDGGLYRRADLELRLDPLDLWAAKTLLGDRVSAHNAVLAYSACGGYPLHLAAWDADADADANLRVLAGSPGGLLLREALDIMFEDLDFRSGYERVLAGMGRGPVRRSRIAGRAQQRVDYTLGRLRRAGYVVAERPLGASHTADPLYRLTDVYLRFWFSVLREDADLIDGGQGAAVLQRVRPRWQSHVQAVWEEVARAHAVRLLAGSALPGVPEGTVIGRWWQDERVELDVVGLAPDDTVALVGEATWQSRPMTQARLDALVRAASVHPRLRPEARFALWSREGAAGDLGRDVVVHTPESVLETGLSGFTDSTRGAR